MYTLKPINPETTNNPDEGEKTIFVDITDGKVKTKDVDGNIAEVAFVDENATAAPLVYKALLLQATTNNPTVTILENTKGDIVWTRTALGTYTGTLTGAFLVNKVTGLGYGTGYVTYFGRVNGLHQLTLNRSGNNTIILYCTNVASGLLAELNNDGWGPVTIDLQFYP